MCCTVLHCVAVRCTVLHCVAVYTHAIAAYDRALLFAQFTTVYCSHRDWTSNNYDCKISNKISRESPYISNTFSRESPSFHTSFHVCKRSPRHSNDVSRKVIDLEIQIFQI